mgnify:CR=1 FL=1
MAASPLLNVMIGAARKAGRGLTRDFGEVEQLLARLRRRIPSDAVPLQKLRAVNQFYFRDLNFGGNVNNYHDPDNSFILPLIHISEPTRPY